MNHILHWGMTSPPSSIKNTTPLKFANCPNPPPPFKQFPHYILVFQEPFLKMDFSVNPHNINIFHP